MNGIEVPADKAADEIETDDGKPVCVMVFNASDPCGAGGLSADITAVASVGAHALPIVTGAYLRDSSEIFGHVAFDDEGVAEQARVVLEDIEAQVIKVGFAGSIENLGVIAALAADYPQTPVVAHMPNLSWWEQTQIERYHDACRELLLPQTTVLTGNHSTLWRWLLPDWDGDAAPTARDIAKAAAEFGVSYTLVTGIALPEQHVDNVLASPQAQLGSVKFELFDGVFSGAGDTLSAALAALVASGSDLVAAFGEALHYLDRSLDGGFRPGMGNILPDRLFWAQPSDEAMQGDAEPPEPDAASDAPMLPSHGTQH